MNKKHNIPVRDAADRNHKYLWEVAGLMGISYSGFMQKMRYEWSQEEQDRVIALINSDKKEGSSHD